MSRSRPSRRNAAAVGITGTVLLHGAAFALFSWTAPAAHPDAAESEAERSPAFGMTVVALAEPAEEAEAPVEETSSALESSAASAAPGSAPAPEPSAPPAESRPLEASGESGERAAELVAWRTAHLTEMAPAVGTGGTTEWAIPVASGPVEASRAPHEGATSGSEEEEGGGGIGGFIRRVADAVGDARVEGCTVPGGVTRTGTGSPFPLGVGTRR